MPHRRLSTARLPGLVLTDHRFEVPLDPAAPGGETISVFGREVVHPDREEDALPWLVFLQGGPGSPAPRPEDGGSWLGRALQEYRVLLLDQRGTGRSTPIEAATVLARGGPEAQAAYLGHFRADGIVADCEAVRRELLGVGERWSVLGQSFGGFCATHYLSAHPEGLREVFVTGGLPPLEARAEDVYRRTYDHMARRNGDLFARYPGDAETLREVVDHLAEREVRLPCGDVLTPRRLQTVGLLLGFSYGPDRVHYLFEDPFIEGPEGRQLSLPFLRGFENATAFDTSPLFSLLHEGCYAQGEATRWAAHRVRAERPEFDVRDGEPVLLTGEAIYPWMLEEVGALRPLREAGELLAAREDWPRLYDPAVLARNEVPVAAAVYAGDMYVDRGFSEETARAIRGCRAWVTSEYEHDALRSSGEKVLGRLIDLVRGRA